MTSEEAAVAAGIAPTDAITPEELQLAARNHGMPLEGLRYDVTPVGLHYLLIHFDIPAVEAATWELEVGGRVRHPLTLSMEDVRSRPAVTLPVTMECAGNGRALLPDPRPLSQPWLAEAVGTGAWLGTPLAPILIEAGLDEDAVEVVFIGLDRGVEGGETQQYERSLSIEEALRDDILLAYGLNGGPLLPQHGFPLRLVVPGWYGMAHVKWLSRITAVAEPFTGYQQAHAYRLRRDEDDPGEPLSRMLPRALMVPPGLASFPERERNLPAGPTTIEGRAWSGWAPVTAVEISVDAGATWAETELEPSPLGQPWAWRGWRFEWEAAPGDHVLCCRARDEEGNEQPDEAAWNVGGYANNGVQRVSVRVL
jgi:DMSO/TMAO reductase YedYZ molybdopterin-dependent catalytic subunit